MNQLERRVDNGILAERIDSLDRHVKSEIGGLKELLRSQREGDQLAVKTALNMSEKLADKHNDLIHQMEAKDATYATKIETERLAHWQARIAGGLAIVAIGVSINAIKVW
jgi:hypothetical protein